jgi:hypothetical protein
MRYIVVYKLLNGRLEHAVFQTPEDRDEYVQSLLDGGCAREDMTTFEVN